MRGERFRAHASPDGRRAGDGWDMIGTGEFGTVSVDMDLKKGCEGFCHHSCPVIPAKNHKDRRKLRKPTLGSRTSWACRGNVWREGIREFRDMPGDGRTLGKMRGMEDKLREMEKILGKWDLSVSR